MKTHLYVHVSTADLATHASGIPGVGEVEKLGPATLDLIRTVINVVERDITMTCVSNEVGGDLIGNAWWSGVRIADLLAEAGVQAGADAVKQTSQDGWTCGTPTARAATSTTAPARCAT